jgi:hypothetical protein
LTQEQVMRALSASNLPVQRSGSCQLSTFASCLLLYLSTRSRRWRLVDGPHADLPSIPLTNIDRRPVAQRKYGTGLPLKSTRPLSGTPNRVVDCIQVIPVEAGVKADNRRPLEFVCIPFLDVLPTAKHPVRFHQKCVLREKCGDCGGVVLVVCLVQRLMKLTEIIKCLGNPEKVTLLDYSYDWLCPSFGRRSAARS